MPVHAEILAAARRICRERGRWAFSAKEIVGALPHLNASTVRTHIISRCCLNAPINHAHKWDYFKRTGRGEYEIRPPYRGESGRRTSGKSRIEEQAAAYGRTEPLSEAIHAVIRRSGGVYVGETLEIAVVTQGRSLDELAENLREAVRLHLEGEDNESLGLAQNPRLVLTYEDPVSLNG